MLGHSTTGNVALGESTSRKFYTLAALSPVVVSIVRFIEGFVALGVLIKILNDPRTLFVPLEDRSINPLDDPRTIKLKRRQ